MGTLKSLFILGSLFALFLAVLVGLAWNYEAPLPEIPQDGWWGAGQRKEESTTDREIKQIKVNVSENVLTDLKTRLSNARYKADIEVESFEYGFRTAYMKEVVTYWKDKYSWRKHEEILNQFDHFQTKIEGINIHFIRAKPKSKSVKTKPLLIIHGWPGSVWEFHKIIPMLTDPTSDVAFDMICPSIPGYGFSEASHKPGLDQLDAGRIFVKLMKRLGYEKFYVQGGDWGGLISQMMVTAFPENILGVHTNMPRANCIPRTFIKQIVGAFFPVQVFGSQEEADKVYPYFENVKEILKESGYYHIQATKPDTVGMALNDSPIGLAAYILEKFGYCTNKSYRDLPDGGTTKKFTLDELLTNVMIYWTNQNIVSSMRFYKEESRSDVALELVKCATDVPAGIASFPFEVFPAPRALVQETYRNIKQYTIPPRGGHFAALEEPRLLADDIISFVKIVEEEINSS